MMKCPIKGCKCEYRGRNANEARNNLFGHLFRMHLKSEIISLFLDLDAYVRATMQGKINAKQT